MPHLSLYSRNYFVKGEGGGGGGGGGWGQRREAHALGVAN